MSELPWESASADPWSRPTTVAPSKTPQYLLVGISVLGIVIAVFRSPLVSAICYVALLIVGSGIVFWDRVRSVSMSRAGVVSARYVTMFDRVAIVALLVACLLNGLVVAASLARG